MAMGSSVGEHEGVRYLWSARLLQVLAPAEAIRTRIAGNGVGPDARPKLPALDPTIA